MVFTRSTLVECSKSSENVVKRVGMFHGLRRLCVEKFDIQRDSNAACHLVLQGENIIRYAIEALSL